MTAPTPERRVGEAWLTDPERGDADDERAEWSDIGKARQAAERNNRAQLRWMTEAQAQRAANARLTAEVERLRGEAGELRALVKYAAQNCDDVEVAELIARRLAALSLPTPAPEATE